MGQVTAALEDLCQCEVRILKAYTSIKDAFPQGFPVA